MGKNAPKAPAAPDPTALANAQAAANQQTAQAQQKLNMVSTSGPQGSVNWVADPNSPGGYRQVTELSPQEQANYQAQTGIYGQALQTAGDQLGRVNQALGQGLNTEGLPTLQGFDGQNFDRQKYEDAAYASATRQLDPRFERQERSQDARLAAQGLGANSEATRNLRQDFERDRTDAYGEAGRQAMLMGGQEQSRAVQNQIAGSTFNNQARGQGLNERAFMQNQPLQNLQALLGTGQVGTPQQIQYTPTSVGQTDVMGANALSLNQQNQNYQNAQAQRNAQMQGLFSLGSAAMTAFSDRRLKRDIVRIGQHASGLALYAYRYLWSDKVETGVMADEVAKVRPNALVVHPSGYMAVNYGAL
jgi:Chaperone of endosialidase